MVAAPVPAFVLASDWQQVTFNRRGGRQKLACYDNVQGQGNNVAVFPFSWRQMGNVNVTILSRHRSQY